MKGEIGMAISQCMMDFLTFWVVFFWGGRFVEVNTQAPCIGAFRFCFYIPML